MYNRKNGWSAPDATVAAPNVPPTRSAIAHGMTSTVRICRFRVNHIPAIERTTRPSVDNVADAASIGSDSKHWHPASILGLLNGCAGSLRTGDGFLLRHPPEVCEDVFRQQSRFSRKLIDSITKDGERT